MLKVGGGQMLRNHGLDVSDALYEYYHTALHAHDINHRLDQEDRG